MPQVPETQASLILRLPCAADAEAWNQFVSLYEPFVYRFARRGGLQDADARELVQNVLMSVARAVGRWQPEETRGKFRTWLFRIARNQLLDTLAKRKVVGKGGTTMLRALDLLPAGDGGHNHEIRLAARRELFLWAADRIKGSVKAATWQAFWQTAVLEKSPDVVAEELGLSVGAVYIARSRVLTRLREEIQKWEDDDAL